MTMSKHRQYNLVATLLLSVSIQCKANVLIELSLDEKSAQSDMVVIGTIGNILPCGVRDIGECHPGASTAMVVVADVLKGTPVDEILFRCREPLTEASPGACAPGEKYLLFLRLDARGVFHSVNGPHGAYLLPKTGSK